MLTATIGNVRKLDGEETLKGTITILEVEHHIEFVRVHEQGGLQEPVDDPHGRFAELQQLYDGCYETVRSQPDAVARELDRLAAAHARGGQTQYYAVRDEQFNPIRDRLLITPETVRDHRQPRADAISPGDQRHGPSPVV